MNFKSGGSQVGVTIDVRIEDGEVRAVLSGIRGRLKDLTPALRTIGETVRSSVIKNFMEGGRPAWKPLKAAGGKTGRPLLRTGRLRDSIRAYLAFRKVKLSSSLPYAGVHQYGRGRTPARPYLVLQKQDVQEIKRFLEDYLTGGEG